jgi:hypothetical protein
MMILLLISQYSSQYTLAEILFHQQLLQQQDIVKSEKENMEIKYEMPRLEIASIIDDRITLKLKESEIDEKYQTSSIEKRCE